MTWNTTYRIHLAQVPYPNVLMTVKDGSAFGLMIWGISNISFSTSFVRKRGAGQLGIWMRVSLFDLKNRLIVGNELTSRIARAPLLEDDGAYQKLLAPIPFAFVCNVPPEHGLLLQLCGVLYTGETRVFESHPLEFVQELSTNVAIQDEIVLGWMLFQPSDRGIKKIETVVEQARDSSVSDLQLIKGNPAELFNDTYDIIDIMTQKTKSGKRAPFLQFILFKYKQKDLLIKGTQRFIIPFFSLIDAVNCPPIFLQKERIRFQTKYQKIEIPGTLLDAPERMQAFTFSIDSIVVSVARFYDFNFGIDGDNTKTGAGALRMVSMRRFEAHIKECVAQLLVPKIADRIGYEFGTEGIKIHILGYSLKVLPHDGFQPTERDPCDVPLYWIADGDKAPKKREKRVRALSGDCRRLIESEQKLLYDISTKQVSAEAMEHTNLRFDMSSAQYGEGASIRGKRPHKKYRKQTFTVQLHAGIVVALCVNVSVSLNSMSSRDFFIPQCEFCIGWGVIDVMPTLLETRSGMIPCTLRLTTDDEFTVGVPGISTPILNCNKITRGDIWGKDADEDSGSERSHNRVSRSSRSVSSDVPKRDGQWNRRRSSSQNRQQSKRGSRWGDPGHKRSSSRYSEAEKSSVSDSCISVTNSSESDDFFSENDLVSTSDYVYEYIYPAVSLMLSLADSTALASPTFTQESRESVTPRSIASIDTISAVQKLPNNSQVHSNVAASLSGEQSYDSLKPNVALNQASCSELSNESNDSDYITQTPTVKQRRHQSDSSAGTDADTDVGTKTISKIPRPAPMLSYTKISEAATQSPEKHTITRMSEISIDASCDDSLKPAPQHNPTHPSKTIEPSESESESEPRSRPKSSSSQYHDPSENSVPQHLPPIGARDNTKEYSQHGVLSAQQNTNGEKPLVTANLEQTLTNIKVYDPEQYKKCKNYAELSVRAISPLQVHLQGIGFIHALYHGSGGDVQEVYGENINLSEICGPKSIAPYNLTTPRPMASQLIGCTLSLLIPTYDTGLEFAQIKARSCAVASCYVSFLKPKGGAKANRRAYYDLYGHIIMEDTRFSDYIVHYQENLTFQAELRTVQADSLFDIAREPIFTLELSVKLRAFESAYTKTNNNILNINWTTYKSMRDTVLASTAIVDKGKIKTISIDNNAVDLLGTQRDTAAIKPSCLTEKVITKTRLSELLDDYLLYIDRETRKFYTAEKLTYMSIRASQILQQIMVIYPHYSGSLCLFPGLEAYEHKFRPDDRLVISLLSPMYSQLEDLSIHIGYRMNDLWFLDTFLGTVQQSDTNIRDRPHWKMVGTSELHLNFGDSKRPTRISSPYVIISSSNPDAFARSAQIQLTFLLEYIRKGSRRQIAPLTSVVNLSFQPYMPLTTNLRVCLPHSLPAELDGTPLNVVFGLNTVTREIFIVSPNYSGCYITTEDLAYFQGIRSNTKIPSHAASAMGTSAIHGDSNCDDDNDGGPGSSWSTTGGTLMCRTIGLLQSANTLMDTDNSNGYSGDTIGQSIHTPKIRLSIIPGASMTFCSLPHIIKTGFGRAGVIYLTCSITKDVLSKCFSLGNNYTVVELWRDQCIVLKFGVTWSIFKHTYSEMSAGVSIQVPTKSITANASLVATSPISYNNSFSIPGPGLYILALFPTFSTVNDENFVCTGLSCVVNVIEIANIAHRYKITINGVENKRFKYQYQTAKVPSVQMEKPSVTRFLGLTPEAEAGIGIVKFKCGKWIWHRPYETTARVLVYSADGMQAPYAVLFYLTFA